MTFPARRLRREYFLSLESKKFPNARLLCLHVGEHFLITKGQDLLVIPESHVPEFKRLLVADYEDRDHGEIAEFMRSNCWRTF